jgi:subtilisin-like proprotein convertase family protein
MNSRYNFAFRVSRKSGLAFAAALALVFGAHSVAQAGPDFQKGVPQAKIGTADLSENQNKKQRIADTDEPTVSPLPQISVKLAAGTNPQVFAAFYGTTVSRIYPGNSVVLNASFAAIPALLNAMKQDRAVLSAAQETRVRYVRHQFAPNDPFYNFNNPTGFPGQWHLHNSSNLGGANIDVNAPQAWISNTPGAGVVIGIVDDGLERTHEDLNPNYSAANSFDFGQNDSDPMPVYADDDHGTSVAGVAGARGGNQLGVVGSAPFGSLAGLRCDFVSGTNTMFANATEYRSSGANTQIKIKNHSYGVTATYVNTTLEQAALNNSANSGTIHVWSAGNSRGSSSQDSNVAMLQNNPNSITVAALGANGILANYSNFGACVFVTAPSSGNFSAQGQVGITTTDRAGNSGINPAFDNFPNTAYTSVFGGTSSAAPLVAGVLALVKQANPNLTPRLAKHLLARFSTQVDVSDSTQSSDGGWVTNAGGFKFNANYGFGNINAEALVQNANTFSGVTPLTTTTTGTVNVSAAIPDATVNNTSPGIILRSFNINSTQKLEEVLVTLNITHTWRGDIEAYLTSPSGTRSRLMQRAGSDSEDNISNWTFCTNKFWGESPQGTWSLEVRDMFVGDVGTWNNFSVLFRQGDVVSATPVNDAEFVSQSVPTTMYRGRPYTVSITMRNNGTIPWTQADLYSLVTENPYSNSTFGSTRRDLNSGETVAPGASRTFTFTAVAPSTVGNYNFQWRMRKRSSPAASFGDFTTNVPVGVIDGNDATFAEQFVPTLMVAGRKHEIIIRMNNTGSRPWTFDKYRLISMNPESNSTWGTSSIRLNSGETVNPGAQKQFYVLIQAPSTPGTYNFQWRMRQLGVEYFGPLTPNMAVEVRPGNNATFVSQTVNTAMAAGATQNVQVRMRNTGAYTWTSPKYVLVSMNPYSNSRWGIKQAVLPSGATVPRDTEVTYNFTITAPTTPGTYSFQWQMRQSGDANFGPITPNINITVN